MTSDFVKAVDELKTFSQNFILNHSAWSSVKIASKLDWKKLKFVPDNLKNVPSAPGVYAFMIGTDNPALPPFSYLVYIGIAGYKANSPRNLRVRYRNYMDEEVDLIRAKVHYFLNKYSGSTYFYYAEVDRDLYSLEDIERELNDKLIPAANINDFSGEIRQQVKAL
jgi:hypothetical protein